ncbi:hypothetical protein I3842_Q093300 [Carya illinoinensis]|uniref:Uncharacterized protein n=1 Tax=Carya illinoinensis TaxID=32201 RepID=A0A922D2K4_CARIL|nr:hypothetical protein I3842_Q093300 [Carya illinoinensis]
MMKVKTWVQGLMTMRFLIETKRGRKIMMTLWCTIRIGYNKLHFYPESPCR